MAHAIVRTEREMAMGVASGMAHWRSVRCALAMLSPLALPVAAEEPAPRIPLEPGLMVVTATHDRGVDYEVFRTVTAADDNAVTFELRRTDPSAGSAPEAEAISVTRIVERQDLASANRVVAYFHTQDPEFFPGSTANQASTGLLEAFERGGDVPFVFGTASGPLGMLGARKYYRGNLRRVEPEPVPISVLLNGVRTTLPAIHVTGELKVGDDAGVGEFWWLDQPDNALALRWTFQDIAVQVIRIDTPAAEPRQEIEELSTALASDLCRAELRGVYFDTGSATLLPQSATEIANIATLLAAQPDWQLTIEGHTDAIGSDADNLLLSQNRAEAVRRALVDGNGIAAGQLTAIGLGEAVPVESNDTFEGRARNRRVEIARQCP